MKDDGRDWAKELKELHDEVLRGYVPRRLLGMVLFEGTK